jgi:hypothetical protein
MQTFYVHLGRRFSIPPTIQLLDEICPDYRAKLDREHRQRVRPPRPLVILSDLFKKPDLSEISGVGHRPNADTRTASDRS